MKYSAAENAFFDINIHGEKIPKDCVEVSTDRYVEIINGQADGYVISSNDDGHPILIEPQAVDSTVIARLAINERLSLANNQISIIKPAVEGGYAKPEHTQLLADWQRYRYELTQVPEQPGWPDNPQFPAEPEKVI